MDGTQALTGLYSRYNSVTGGDETQSPQVIGGLESVRDYANTVMSKAKEQLIRDIARDMKTKFKVEGKGSSKVTINPDADLDTLIGQLKKAIPNPNVNGRVWSDKLKVQKSTCRQLARIINRNYGFSGGDGPVNENGTPEEICEQVSEVMYTLFSGMHGEFLNVRADTERVLKNLHHLKTLLDRNYKHLQHKIADADPENIASETKLAREGHQLILDEWKRQQTLLENTLNVVINEKDKELIKLMKESKDFKRLVNKIKAMPGTGKFGEKISFVLSGIGSTAQMAQAVNSALKKVQMSTAEYGRQKSLKDLQNTIFDKLQDKLKGSSAKQLADYIAGAKTLFRYEYNRPEIMAELGKRGGDGDDDEDAYGGDDTVDGGLKLDKRVKKRQELRKEIVRAFNRQLGTHLERINKATEHVARATGSSVPVTDTLRTFTKRLELIPDIEKRHIYFALTGYYNDPASKEERDIFLNNVNSLIETLEKMVKMKEYSGNGHVKDLLRSWTGITKLVHDYVAKFAEGFGPIAPKISPSKYEGEGEDDDYDDEMDSVSGGGGLKVLFAPIRAGLSDDLKNISGPGSREANQEDPREMGLAVDNRLSVADQIYLEFKKAAKGESNQLMEIVTTHAANMRPLVENALRKLGIRNVGADEDAKEHYEPGEEEDAVAGAAQKAQEQDDLVEGGALTGAEISRLAWNLSKAKEVMRYFFRAADIRKNMKYIAPELKKYGADYEKVLGDAVARVRDNISKVANADLKDLKNGENRYAPLKATLKLQVLAAKAGASNQEQEEDAKVRLKELAKYKEKFYNTKIEMMKCAEAMDLYMKHFTDGIVSNINDVQKIEVMLRGTEIISKWFTNRSGNLICSVFDTFPSHYTDAGEAIHSNLPFTWEKSDPWGDKIHYYWRVQGLCLTNMGGDSLGHDGLKANADDARKRLTDVDSKNTDLKDLYRQAGNDYRAEDIAPFRASIVGTADRVNANSLPGVPYMGILPNKEAALGNNKVAREATKGRDAFKAMEYVTKAFQNVSVLKNLIAAFVAIGDRFGGQNIRKKTHMSPSQIYECLINYMTVGSFSMGLKNVDVHGAQAAADRLTHENANIRYDTYNLPDTSMAEVDNVRGFRQGISGDRNRNGVLGDLGDLTVIMRRAYANDVMVHADLFGDGAHNAGCNTDEMFQFVIKAMVAKILTVIGVYNMLHRPVDRHGLGYSSFTRWTLGGAVGYPKIIPEALELYIRLPLLVEFYRDIFDFDNGPAAGPPRKPVLSMIPEMEGTFRGLIELIFDRAKHVQYGTYSENDIKTMIEEINKIYMQYRGGKNVVSDVVHELIAEVNRRYGILVDRERERYKDQMNERYLERYDSFQGDDSADFDILPDELGSKVGPSDAFVTEGKTWKTWEEHKWTMRVNKHQEFIYELRSAMDDRLDRIWPGANYDPINGDTATGVDGLEKLRVLSFENLIKARKEELRYAKSAKEQFQIVQNAISGLGEFSANSQERSLILFHETVVVGLNALTALFSQVRQFHQLLWDMADRVGVDAVGLDDNVRQVELRTFIELLHGHCISLDGLVECQMEVIEHPLAASDQNMVKFLANNPNARKPVTLAISIDHSKLYELVERELHTMKMMLDKFRGLINKDIIHSYEALKDKNGQDQVGSIYWLEKHFMHELLAGKVKGTPPGGLDWTRNHLGRVNEKVRSIMHGLTMPVLAGAGGPINQTNFTVIIDEQVSFTADMENAVGPYNPTGPALLEQLTHELAANAAIGNTKMQAYATHLYSRISCNLRHHLEMGSALCMFNKLVAGYICHFFDDQSKKIYVNTINTFANGAFSNSVMKGEWVNDENIGRAGAPGFAERNNYPNVLYKSLSLILRNLLVAKVPGKTYKYYLETDLSEIPLFMQENYKANMPVFAKLFTLLLKKCEMLKHFVSGAGVVNNQENLGSTLDRVILGCNSMLSCIREVMEELADSPLYLETHKDSIKEYEGLNGQKPVMPLSSMLYLLQNQYIGERGRHIDNYHVMNAIMPVQNLGSHAFKLLYGVRGVLALDGAGSLAKLPGMRDILQKHNETTEAEYHCDEKQLENHVRDSVSILRYLINGVHYRKLLTVVRPGVTLKEGHLEHRLVEDPASEPTKISTANSIRLNRAVYQIGKNSMQSLANVMSLTTSSRQRDARQNLVNTIEDVDKTIVRGTREDIQMMNIIDLNVVPVNLHALQREMPLVNLYNYSYTFDNMVCSMTGIDPRMAKRSGFDPNHIGWLDAYPVHERARKLLGHMLMHPYAEMEWYAYHDYFARIVRGAVGLPGLGRPKFLGDELYNKALFGEIYTSDAYYDEAGPGVGHGRLVGDNMLRKLSKNDIIYSSAVLWGTNLRDLNLDRWDEIMALRDNHPIKTELFGLIISLANGTVSLEDAAASLSFRGTINIPEINVDVLGNIAAYVEAENFESMRPRPIKGIRENRTHVGRVDYNRDNEPNQLRYFHKMKNGKGVIVPVNVGPFKHTLQNIGKLRFDTFYCRSLVWLTNIQRVLRLQLRRDLEWYDSKIVRDNAVTSPEITELYGNDTNFYRDPHFSH